MYAAAISIFEASLWNAVAVVPLAAVVWCVAKVIRQPAVEHALWIVVLLKFVTPPLLTLPIPVSFLPATSPAPSPEEATLSQGAQDGRSVSSPDFRAGPVADSSSSPGQASPFWARISARSLSVSGAIAAGWVCTSFLWIAIQSWRCVRFSRQLQSACIECVELDREFERLISRLGLRQRPGLLVLRAVISPMLWGFGRQARIVVPELLVAEMDPTKRMGLLAHELAHYCRGDHWTRVLEFVVLALFWWHPVAWWARREIEASEEQCCDGWVLERLPGDQRPYAAALLDTIDFLCEIRNVRIPAASPFSESRLLKQRLVRIMENQPAAVLTQRHRVMVSLVALVVLPIQPLAVSAPRQSVQPVLAVELPAEITSPPGLGDEQPEVAGSPLAPAEHFSDQQGERSIRSRRGERDLSIIVAPGGRSVIRKTTGYRTVLIDLATSAETDLSSLEIVGVAFLNDGRSFVSLEPGGAKLRDSRAGKLLRTLSRLTELSSLAVAPLGELIAIAGSRGAISLVHAESGEVLHSFDNGPDNVTCVRFSPDGQRVAVCSGDWRSRASAAVTIWNLTSRSAERTIPLRETPGACAFASGDELIVATFDGTISLWNLRSGECVASGSANRNIVPAAAFSPDNSLLREVIFQALAR
jgi:bla regulator protein blaR1